MAKRKRKTVTDIVPDAEVTFTPTDVAEVPTEELAVVPIETAREAGVPVVAEIVPPSEPVAEPDPSDDEEAPRPNSVVAAKFKERYIENAKAQGITGKAARRSNWDWLSQEIAAECLGPKHKINIDSFIAILDANGVDYSRWTNRNRGWEGRFRMTGRVALQRIVANAGALHLPGGRKVEAPAEWADRYRDKD